MTLGDDDMGEINDFGIDGEEAPNFALKRWNTCLDCDRLFRPTRQCKECGCFMKIKVRIRRMSCPLGKW
jgi:hypothetical protein